MSRIHSDIDFNAPGKQIGHLRIPCPRNDSAWGVLMLPMAQIKGAKGSGGPTVLLTAGQHGDEYEGPLALNSLIRELEPETLRGTVLVVPAMNLPALEITRRLSPLDGRDMNRSFPGQAEGSVTEMIADYVARFLLPQADWVMDFHSGGRSLDFVSSGIMHRLPDPVKEQKTLEALKAFGAPYSMILAELDATGMFDSLVEQSGIPFLSTELRGAGQVSTSALKIARRGLRNLLRHLGMLEGDVESYPTRLIDVPGPEAYTHAPRAGIFERAVELGEALEAGQTLGWLHDLAHPQLEPLELKAQISGILVTTRPLAAAQAGDCLAVMGVDLD